MENVKTGIEWLDEIFLFHAPKEIINVKIPKRIDNYPFPQNENLIFYQGLYVTNEELYKKYQNGEIKNYSDYLTIAYGK